ncbi:MAG: hypothetical protein KC593_04460, partial [Myxococcales bacterium]|nr:hypothetical protein [Myxococcales bacterium]
IDQLAELASHPALARDARRTALRLLARYADERADALSDVETERLMVALGAHDASLTRAFALRRSWSAHDPEALVPAAAPTAAQTIAHLLQREALSDAVSALRQARAESAHADAAGSLYAAAWLAACTEDQEVAREGTLLLAQLLRHGTRAPHGGFLRLARALEGPHPALASLALERAAARREPSALEALGTVLVEQAWRAYGEGDRAAALRALRRADRLACETVHVAPP